MFFCKYNDPIYVSWFPMRRGERESKGGFNRGLRPFQALFGWWFHVLGKSSSLFGEDEPILTISYFSKGLKLETTNYIGIIG